MSSPLLVRVVTLAAPFVAILLVVWGVVAMNNPEPGDPVAINQEKYTVVINTFRRNDLLARCLEHYSRCPSVDQLAVVWSDLKNAPPQDFEKHVHGDVPLHFEVHTEDSLNNRLKPMDAMRTVGLFSVDDDVLIPCGDLEFAFSVWRGARDSVVGFVPRLHVAEPDGSWRYSTWWDVWRTGSYSMVFPKCAFLHKKYLDEYTNVMPQEIRDHIDSKLNCEDIALNFMVAANHNLPPIWVRGDVVEIGDEGISSAADHMAKRTGCLNYFTQVYGRNPLITTRVKVTRASSSLFW